MNPRTERKQGFSLDLNGAGRSGDIERDPVGKDHVVEGNAMSPGGLVALWYLYELGCRSSQVPSLAPALCPSLGDSALHLSQLLTIST